MNSFFQLDGPFMRVMTDVMNLIILNVLTLIFSVPIVTAGAAFTAMHYILMQMGEQEDGRIIATFWEQFKLNLKTSTLPWLLVLCVGVFLFVDFRLISVSGNRYLLIPIYACAVIFMMIFVWLFPLMARFENTCMASLRNAVLCAIGHMPRSLCMAAITVLIPYFFIEAVSLFPLALFMGLSLPAYLCMFIYRGPIKKLVEKFREEHPDSEPGEESRD